MFFNTIPQEGVFTNTTKQMLNIGNVLFKHAVITRVIILGFLFYSTQTTGQEQEERVDGQIITTGQTYFNSSLKKKETATNDYINFYQKYISGIRGQSCPMYPSCSNYGLKTFGERNFISAFAMMSDRIIRCGHDHSNYSLALRKNGFKYLDYPAYDKTPIDLYYKSNSYYYAYSDASEKDKSLNFIKSLINNQYHEEALLEIMRIEFNSKTFDINLFINKIICLKAIGEYEKALFEYEDKCPKEYKSNNELLLQVALIHHKLGNFDKVIELNTKSINTFNDTYKPKIILLNGLTYAKKDNWENSFYSFEKLSKYKPYQQMADVNKNISQKALDFKYKSPKLAGLLSIIPGLGYAYTGHKQTALSAFLVNSLIGYATYTNIKNANYGMGILTGVFNLSFYLGNIYGGIKSAKRYNEQQKKLLINKIEFNTNF